MSLLKGPAAIDEGGGELRCACEVEVHVTGEDSAHLVPLVALVAASGRQSVAALDRRYIDDFRVVEEVSTGSLATAKQSAA